MTKKHNGSQRAFGRRGRRDIPLENDAMFAEVMRRKDLCIGLLETIFEGRRIRDIVYEDGLSPEAQKYIAFNPGNKSMLEFADFNQERPLNSTEVRVKQNNRTQPIDRLSVLRHFTIGSIGVLAKFT